MTLYLECLIHNISPSVYTSLRKSHFPTLIFVNNFVPLPNHLLNHSGNYKRAKPYLCGSSCSGCTRKERCYRNQCMRNAQLNQVHPTDRFPDPEDKYVPQCVRLHSNSAVPKADCESALTNTEQSYPLLSSQASLCLLRTHDCFINKENVRFKPLCCGILTLRRLQIS